MLQTVFSWETLRWIMLVLYLPSCVGLIVIVLLQKGKGTSFAGAFGLGPGSDAVFGPRASKSLPVRMTYVMAGLFLILALGLSGVEGKVGKGPAPSKVTIDQSKSEVPSSALKELGLGSAYETGKPATEGEQPKESTPEGAAATPTEVTTIPPEVTSEGPETAQPDRPSADAGAVPEVAPPVAAIDPVGQALPGAADAAAPSPAADEPKPPAQEAQ